MKIEGKVGLWWILKDSMAFRAVSLDGGYDTHGYIIYGERLDNVTEWENERVKSVNSPRTLAPGVFIYPDNVNIYDVAEVNNEGTLPTIVSDWRELERTIHLKRIIYVSIEVVNHIKELEKETGIKANEIDISEVDIQSFFNKLSPKLINSFHFHNPQYVLDVAFKIKPKTFGEVIKLFVFLHGTQVWKDNGEKLFDEGCPLNEIIAFREDIMNYLLQHGMDRKTAYSIMEKARMKKGDVLLTTDDEKLMRDHNIPDWYIDSIKKLVYIFPKAHAV